jgi:signal transduction histidine kinase
MRRAREARVALTMLARLRALDPFRADLLIAAVFLVEAFVELVVLLPDDAPHQWAMVLLILVEAAGLAVRRRYTVLAVLAVMPVQLIANSLGHQYGDTLVTPWLVILLMLYTIGRHLEGRTMVALAVYAGVVLVTTNATDSYDDTVGDFFVIAGLLVAAPIIIGRALRHRAGLHRTLVAKKQRLERERAVSAATAAEQERARIAKELHDVVAHALSAMVVQASGARRLAERNPQRAGEAFLAVEHSGREALTEIRRLLGVLRHDDEELALAPQPSLRHVSTLVNKAQAAGLPVQLDVDGEERDLPIGLDLTAYRVIQEALGGALEHGHAGGAVVRLHYGTDHVEVEVADDGGNASRPLLGIRERVALSGGQLRAGARRDGGHVVRARLPLEGSA